MKGALAYAEPDRNKSLELYPTNTTTFSVAISQAAKKGPNCPNTHAEVVDAQGALFEKTPFPTPC